MKFLLCQHCGELVAVIKEGACTPKCCGEKMTLLEPKSPEFEGNEKHVPVVKINGDEVLVEVGSNPHPMMEDHLIEWIALFTDRGGYRKKLNPGEAPKALFTLEKGEKVLEVYSYCNKHGLWAAKI